MKNCVDYSDVDVDVNVDIDVDVDVDVESVDLLGHCWQRANHLKLLSTLQIVQKYPPPSIYQSKHQIIWQISKNQNIQDGSNYFSCDQWISQENKNLLNCLYKWIFTLI